MQTLSIISSIKNINKHALIDHFHFKHETRENKRKVIELSLQEITIRSDNKFTMQCYNTETNFIYRIAQKNLLLDWWPVCSFACQ